MWVLRARGFESEGELAFAALGDVLRPLTGHLASLPDAQRSALESALAIGPPVGGDPLTVCVASLDLLAAAADEQPILAVVDDAQWLDRVSAQTLAVEWAPHGIRLNTICPGPTDTVGAGQALWPAPEDRARVERTVPAGRLATVEEIAWWTTVLCS